MSRIASNSKHASSVTSMAEIYVCKIGLEVASSLIHRLLILSSCRAKLGGYFMTFLVCIPLHLCQSIKGHFVTLI